MLAMIIGRMPLSAEYQYSSARCLPLLLPACGAEQFSLPSRINMMTPLCHDDGPWLKQRMRQPLRRDVARVVHAR